MDRYNRLSGLRVEPTVPFPGCVWKEREVGVPVSVEADTSFDTQDSFPSESMAATASVVKCLR